MLTKSYHLGYLDGNKDATMILKKILYKNKVRDINEEKYSFNIYVKYKWFSIILYEKGYQKGYQDLFDKENNQRLL